MVVLRQQALEIIKKHKPLVTLELNHFCLNVLRRVTVPDFFDFLRSVFPYLYAVGSDNMAIANLHDQNEAYRVMYEHVVHNRYPNIVAGFDALVVDVLQKLKRTKEIRAGITPAVNDARGHLKLVNPPQSVKSDESFYIDVKGIGNYQYTILG